MWPTQVMTSGTTWLGLSALVLITVLLDRGCRAALGVAILVVSVISW